MAPLVVVALAMGCEGGRSTKQAPPDNKPAAPSPALAPAPKPAEPWKPPGRGVDATKIIWRTQAEVVRELGKGEKRPDGKWKHDLPDAPGHFVVVTYEKGRAVEIMAPTLGVEWTMLSDEEQDRLVRWFGRVDEKATAAGRKILTGPSKSSESVATYDAEYAERLDKQIEAEAEKQAEKAARERAANLLRGRVHLEQLSRAIAARGGEGGFRVVDDAEDEVLWVTDLCTRALLEDMAHRMASSFTNFGFRKMWCGGMSADLK